ncbi:MAG: hypothetical protein GEU93_08555 [Propionibacteriales bacterium]|nr:hypothetical protein [Propionibacteriales bacterium]
MAAQQWAVDRLAERRDRLVAELAEAQDVSVELAEQRQAALERRAELRRQRAAEAAAERAREREQAHAQQEQQAEEPAPEPEPEPEPEPAPAPTPAPSSGAEVAIDFAYAQLGEPYVWAGDGPDEWDCSGLTMRAWGAAGEYLPHYSVAQYYETSRVSYSELQRGDLIFWASDSGNPDTIFHVGLYIGNDQMIHAPRTGEPVKVENIWYWESPDFFGRV